MRKKERNEAQEKKKKRKGGRGGRGEAFQPWLQNIYRKFTLQSPFSAMKEWGRHSEGTRPSSEGQTCHWRKNRNRTIPHCSVRLSYLFSRRKAALLTFACPFFPCRVQPDLGVISWRQNEEEKGSSRTLLVELEGATVLKKVIYHAYKKKGLNHSVKEALDVSGQVQVKHSLQTEVKGTRRSFVCWSELYQRVAPWGSQRTERESQRCCHCSFICSDFTRNRETEYKVLTCL